MKSIICKFNKDKFSGMTTSHKTKSRNNLPLDVSNSFHTDRKMGNMIYNSY